MNYSGENLKIRVSFESKLKDGSTKQQVEKTKTALRGLGLYDNVEIS